MLTSNALARAFSNFLSLPLAEKWLSIKIIFLLYTYRLSLQVFSFASIKEFAEGKYLLKTKKSKENYLSKLSKLLEILSKRLLGTDNCLLRSLVFAHLSNKRGIPSRIMIGVRNSDSATLDAHAWVVDHDGLTIFEESTVGLPFSELLNEEQYQHSLQKASAKQDSNNL